MTTEIIEMNLIKNAERFKVLVMNREYPQARDYFNNLREDEQAFILRREPYKGWLRALRFSSL
jgi:hypothetical protein